MHTSGFDGARRKTERRGYITLVAFFLVSVLLVFNILRLDLFAYDSYRDKAYDQITTTSTLKAERGSIYDSSMNLLATTKTVWRVFVSPKAIKTASKKDGKDYASLLSGGLSEIFSLDYNKLYEKMSDYTVLDLTVAKAASEEQYKRVVDFTAKASLESLLFTEAQTSRFYPSGTLAAHVLGFTGSDNQGLYGLEYSYNSLLSGKDGYYLYAKDANGNPMPGGYTDIVEAVDGSSIVTTIDSYIQTVLEGELSSIVKNHSVTGRATGIVMDTKTGAVLAMATSSPFDPNSPYELDALSLERLCSSGYAEGSDEYKALKSELMQIMWSNKAVSETYEPGSTFKIVTVAAALDSGSAKMTDTFSCTGSHTVGGYNIRCHKRTGHGSGFSLAYGLQMSCNPTMMAIAERTGADTFYSYVEKFGYLERTGIDLPSEARSIFHNPDAIGVTELATASFGQRFKVSIINQLTAIAAVANGGYLVTPYLVERVIDENGNTIKEHETKIKRRVISEEVAAEIAKALEEGVSGDGGAKNAYVEGYSVAAKTGTSQKFDILDENGNSYLRIGSTVAFAPSDESGIAAIIVVDEPQSSVKYGSTVAAPYISNLFSAILPYLEYERTSADPTYTVGSYVGMNINSAKDALENDGVGYTVIGDGSVVISQLPAASIDITKSLSKVYLYTVTPERDTVAVPNLVGLGIAEANRILANEGLNVKISGVTDLKSNILKVVRQSVPEGYTVKRGSVIELTVLCTDHED
ncbi:MAG: PASTA domain-containing protein [Clostridia bacterium]|nr:PASTA domain-containing protein [Clostridia bacterium]